MGVQIETIKPGDGKVLLFLCAFKIVINCSKIKISAIPLSLFLMFQS